MITRKYTYLAGEEEFKNVEIPIYNTKNIGLVYAKNKGFGLYNDVGSVESSLFIISTKITPEQFDENPTEKEQFIQLISANLAEIYAKATGLKEYEKKHPEYIFIQLMDVLKDKNCKKISSNDELFNIVNDGFARLDVDILKNLL